MRIRFDQATAAQLRQYLKERYNIDAHHFSKPPSLIRKIQEIDPGCGDDFELTDAVAEAQVAETAQDPEAPAADNLSDTQKLINALVDQGMPHDEAAHLAGKTMLARNADLEMPTGEDFDNSWFTIQINRADEAGGSDPVPVLVNGIAQRIPRGEAVPVRAPYVEVLRHAEKIVYDPVMEADGIRTRMVPRVVPQYPFTILAGPYGRDEANRLLAKRREAQTATGMAAQAA